MVRGPDIRSTGCTSNLCHCATECNPGQVVYTRASVTKQSWYRPPYHAGGRLPGAQVGSPFWDCSAIVEEMHSSEQGFIWGWKKGVMLPLMCVKKG